MSLLSKLLIAIMVVESGGNVDAKPGDQGRSRGVFQIQKAYWDEACQFGKVDWDYLTDVKDPVKSAQVVLWYWQRYHPKSYALVASGNLSACEMLAKVHNGGPGGHRIKATNGYWKKVLKEMDKL